METEAEKPRVLVLCGGSGSRFIQSLKIDEKTQKTYGLDSAEIERLGKTPKPLLEVGHVPVVEHVMRSFKARGFNNFIIKCGGDLDEIRTSLSELQNEGYLMEYYRPDHEKTLLQQVIDARPSLGGRFFLALGVSLTGADYRMMLDMHVREGNTITTLMHDQGQEEMSIAGVSLIESSALDDPTIEKMALQGYDLITSGRPRTREDSLWGLMSLGRQVSTKQHVHIRRLQDLIHLRSLYGEGKAFWPGAYEKMVERLAPEGLENTGLQTLRVRQ